MHILHRGCSMPVFLCAKVLVSKVFWSRYVLSVYLLASKLLVYTMSGPCSGPRLPCQSRPLLQSFTVKLESWQAGSAYRIQPIQERAKRPQWTINNGASGFVSCLWEHRKRIREHVMKSEREKEGGGWRQRWTLSSAVLCSSFIPAVWEHSWRISGPLVQLNSKVWMGAVSAHLTINPSAETKLEVHPFVLALWS